MKWILAGLMLLAAPLAQAASVDSDFLSVPELGGSYDSDLVPDPALPPELTERLDRARALFLDGDFEAAEEIARSLTEAAPEAAAGWHLYGLILANQERYDAAIAALERAGELYTLNAEPFIVQGDILLFLGRIDEAQAAFEAAIARDPANWRGAEAAALLAESQGDPARAIELYRTALQTAPADRFLPRLRLTRLLTEAERADEAVAVMEAYLGGSPDEPRGLLALGSAQLAAGDLQAATATLERLVEVAPGSALAQMHLGKAQLLAGETEAAEAALLAARELDPDAPRVHFELGNYYGAVREYEASLDSYEAGIDLIDGSAQLLRGARMAAYRLERMETARDYAEQVVAAAGAGTAADYFWLGFLSEAAGDPDRAAEAYEAGLAQDPANWQIANNLAVVLTPRDPERAYEIANEAATRAPEATAVQATLGWAAFQAGRSAEARAIYESLAAREEPQPRHLYRLGVILIEEGDTAAGRSRLEAALARDPGFDGAEDARARLAE